MLNPLQSISVSSIMERQKEFNPLYNLILTNHCALIRNRRTDEYRLQPGPDRIFVKPWEEITLLFSTKPIVKVVQPEIRTRQKHLVEAEVRVLCTVDLQSLQQKPGLLARLSEFAGEGGLWEKIIESRLTALLHRMGICYTQEELRQIDIQTKLDEELTELLANQVKWVGLKVGDMQIIRIGLHPSLQKAVIEGEKAAVETQNRLNREMEQAKIEAEKRILTAKTEAQEIILQAQAEAKKTLQAVRSRAAGLKEYQQALGLTLSGQDIITWEWLHTKQSNDHIPPGTQISMPFPGWGNSWPSPGKPHFMPVAPPINGEVIHSEKENGKR